MKLAKFDDYGAGCELLVVVHVVLACETETLDSFVLISVVIMHRLSLCSITSLDLSECFVCELITSWNSPFMRKWHMMTEVFLLIMHLAVA